MPSLSTSSLDLAAILLGDDEPELLFTDEELIPVRMLNEFTYCPRLAYLEWVQGEFTDNLDTKQGTFGHRNVDRPSARPIPAAQGPCQDSAGDNETAATEPLLKTRALTLSAYREGLVAKLDLLELEGSSVTPVEYKKGAIPPNPHQAWEPERVQLCAQGLILRENGYQCDSGELYYIESRHRVTVPFDDALILRTRELVRRLREMGRTEQIPLPLVDSPKCPRCSLVGICLPDETNLLLRDNQADAASTTNTPPIPRRPLGALGTPAIRQLIPARDDALPLYIKEQGAYVGKDGERLVVRHREAKLVSVPLIEVSQLSLFGNVQMSAQALREVVDRGIPVCHFSYGGWFVAMTTGHVRKNIELRIAQFAAAADPETSLSLARGFITAKIKNGRTMLRRHAHAKNNGSAAAPPNETPPVTEDAPVFEPSDHDPTLASRNGSSRDLEQLAEWAQKAQRAPSAESLLGLEGMAAKIYFSGLAKLLKGGDTFDFRGRNRRPPRDPINALLSFVYSLLAKEVTIAVQAVGFDPLLGFFHKPRYGRPSLALDLAEEFRPLIGDSTVMMLINNGEIAQSSFLSRAGAVTLTEPGRKAVIAAFERRMEQEITHPIFGYKISYRRVLEVQARLLSRVVLGELAAYPGFCTR
ncbi:CRISPR-associated endonuclease Cas4/Cas1 [Schlesneria paludicola]|uniref:CRISPR-associated endonuclease Cas4/Cas1 n=1 Tax=Schlesneria paludicola TaxID=360056 RepID=UPI00029A2A55|nr:CRISPR-associated endonuclease Cas4/Cas1 [Schlesneria paludicola]